MKKEKFANKRLLALFMIPVFAIGFLLLLPATAQAAEATNISVSFTPASESAKPGETVNMSLALANSSTTATTQDVTVKLTSDLPNGTTITEGALEKLTQESGDLTWKADPGLKNDSNAHTVAFSFTAPDPAPDASKVYTLTAIVTLDEGDKALGGDKTSLTFTAKVTVGKDAPAVVAASDAKDYGAHHVESWGPVLSTVSEMKTNGTLRLDCRNQNLDFIPHYIITAAVNSKCKMVLTWDIYTFTIDGRKLGNIDPDANYRFVDSYNMGLAKPLA